MPLLAKRAHHLRSLWGPHLRNWVTLRPPEPNPHLASLPHLHLCHLAYPYVLPYLALRRSVLVLNRNFTECQF